MAQRGQWQKLVLEIYPQLSRNPTKRDVWHGSSIWRTISATVYEQW
jgi:hypothetical protein